jgi:hypothetical protein
MTEPARSAPRTAAALAARRRDTQSSLDRVDDAIARLRREKTPVSVAAVARRCVPDVPLHQSGGENRCR